MLIKNCTINDVEKILDLYKEATKLQIAKSSITWPKFDKNMIETDIKDLRQWKIIIDNQIACIWTITYNDPEIWEEKDNEASIYIHRISTNPSFRGKNLAGNIVEWAKQYAKENNKTFIRLDTVGENLGLRSHYQKLGFTYLGFFTLKNTSELPAHYHNMAVSLYEINLNDFQ